MPKCGFNKVALQLKWKFSIGFLRVNLLHFFKTGGLLLHLFYRCLHFHDIDII